MEIEIAKTIGIREAGQDEYWLQNIIYENPGCLNLGELESIRREKQQSSGGRLDILLKNPEDDSMYEVEIMLGETDESHIIRTIEYWDNEKRRWPQRQHYAVLVAESITRRYFNVIQLLSHSIPIIAIQVNLIESNGSTALHFSKILDTYEEPEDGCDDVVYNELYWTQKAPWALETARAVLQTTSDLFDSANIRFVKSSIGVTVHGNNYFWLQKRSAAKSLFGFRIADEHIDDCSQLLDEHNITFNQKRNKFKFKCDAEFVKNNPETIRQIAGYVKQYWQK